MNRYWYIFFSALWATLFVAVFGFDFPLFGESRTDHVIAVLSLMFGRLPLDLLRKKYLGLRYFPNHRIFSDEYFDYIGKLYWGTKKDKNNEAQKLKTSEANSNLT